MHCEGLLSVSSSLSFAAQNCAKKSRWGIRVRGAAGPRDLWRSDAIIRRGAGDPGAWHPAAIRHSPEQIFSPLKSMRAGCGASRLVLIRQGRRQSTWRAPRSCDPSRNNMSCFAVWRWRKCERCTTKLQVQIFSSPLRRPRACCSISSPTRVSPTLPRPRISALEASGRKRSAAQMASARPRSSSVRSSSTAASIISRVSAH